MIIQHRTKRIVTIAFVSFVSMAAGLAWLWVMTEINGQRLEAEAELVAQDRATEAALLAMSEVASSSARERAQLEQYLLNRDETITLLATVESYAADQYLEFVTDSLDVVEQKDARDLLELTVRMTGVSNNVRNMIEILESLPYHSTVTDVTISADEADRVTARLTVVVSLTDDEL